MTEETDAGATEVGNSGEVSQERSASVSLCGPSRFRCLELGQPTPITAGSAEDLTGTRPPPRLKRFCRPLESHQWTLTGADDIE
jgi:hypothetical protein